MALQHPTMGVLILPTLISYGKLLARIAIGLHKRPELIAHLTARNTSEEGEGRVSLPERAANLIRECFTACLNAESVTRGKPVGKQHGIYALANLCLKILFQCKKTSSASTIFENVSKRSPLLSEYPRSQRVTYLYYLGRWYFEQGVFNRGQLALQKAYDESPVAPQVIKQRRLILVYLITTNIILGRFPSQTLLQRPEAEGLAGRFLPLCRAIAKGDLYTFRKYLDFDGPYAAWFLHFKILLQLRNRCEVLVWRSLVRRVFILSGDKAETASSAKAAPIVDLQDVLHAFRYLEAKISPSQSRPYTDPDFDGIDEEEFANEDVDMLPGELEIESIMSSLRFQGLLNGFLSHARFKFAIKESRSKGGPLAAGFPIPWQVFKPEADHDVPGWKTSTSTVQLGGIINLAGAQPAGGN